MSDPARPDRSYWQRGAIAARARGDHAAERYALDQLILIGDTDD